MLSEQNVPLNGVTVSPRNGADEEEVDIVMCSEEEEEVDALGEGAQRRQPLINDQQRRLAFIRTTTQIQDEVRKAEQGQASGQNIERLFDQVYRSDIEIDHVDNMRTLCKGSESLDQLIQLSVTQVEGLKDETAHNFDPGKLVARLKSFAISHRKPGDFDDFATIGRHFSFLLRKTPNFSYLRPCYELKLDGPHLREKTRKRPTLRTKEEAQIVQGKTLSEMDESAAASKDGAAGSSSTAVNKELDNVRRHLKRVYKQNGTDSVDYYRFVLHPDSFGETVENMFFVSFLIRDGQVRLRVDPRTGLASIVKLSREEREERCCARTAERPKTQTVPRLDYATWRCMVRELNIDVRWRTVPNFEN